MTGLASLVPVAGALALVLGAFLVAAHLVRRTLPGGAGRNPGRSPEVMGRVHLAPNQGLAAVRVEGRTLLVSFGEGGVRLVTELEGEDGAQAAAAPPPPSDRPPGEGVLGRRARVFRALACGALLLATAPVVGVGSLSGESGRTDPVEATEFQVPPMQPRTPTVQPPGAEPPGSPPTFDLQIGGQGPGEGLRVRGPVGTVLFIGALTLLPTLLLLMTSFTRILVVLHLLKQALGTQTAPPAHLLAAMALLLTFFVMGPTLEEANRTALVPWLNGEIDEAVMMQRASVPFREFMLTQVREEDLAAFAEMRPGPLPESVDELPLTVVTSAFVTSELRSAFQMGFALFLPFVVIDLVVASVLMSMGMFMLPPVMISLPFKLLLFVMVDGWSILVGSLVRSFF